MARPVRLRIPNELGQYRTLPDAAGPDDVAPDKAGPDGSLPDNIPPDGSLPDNIPPDGSLPDNILPDGSLPATFDVLPPCWQRVDAPADVVVLGLGPNPATAQRAVDGALARLRETDTRSGKHSAPTVHVIECPAFIHYMEEATRGAWRTAIPAGWTLTAPDDFPPDRLARALVVVYREAERLFPTFWGPLLGAARAVRMAPALALPPEGMAGHAGPHSARSRIVLLPGTEGSLLLPELESALAAEGLTPRRADPDTLHADLPRLLADQRPELFLSVNLQGLDAWGERFHLLRACGVDVAVWCVDNPFHLLSALRGPWWRGALLCVTDASFIPLLRAHGAQRVLHLPLATGPEFFGPHPSGEGRAAGAPQPSPAGMPPLNPVVFVGRSAFPGKRSFFAGQHIAPALLDEALALLDTPGLRPDVHYRPDFHWWTARLGLTQLWPGNAVREAGLGAEECALARRVRCLNAAAPLGLTVFGDDGWQPLLAQGTDLRPPVDYYATLPAVYRAARWSLNITSLLLPAGLTQRHFDVWAAGGFCITDDTPGLDIFPEELRREIAFSPAGSGGTGTANPAAPVAPPGGEAPGLIALLHRLEGDAALRADLATAWRGHILSHHTYRHRVRTLCKALGLE
ncbi:glycosyltransferase [Desulfovibrio oxamicus]|uniref:Glycosyltransferase n=1 Tax=Nitratidesulfovibrio oxamicus TaxID=32016 RepID=A0ABS0J2V1_9BACT|nr:glycosyltransferase [Nitratidesulfovibrio oxamicus]MBG3876301.1 glycosyltransferase [Nitratidesulfovibrio oxamicus]